MKNDKMAVIAELLRVLGRDAMVLPLPVLLTAVRKIADELAAIEKNGE